MVQALPGTTIELDERRWSEGEEVLDCLFLAGGLTLSQVAQLTGLEPHVIQNWVKRGFLPPPNGRKYNKNQFCRLALMNMLRSTLPLPQITALLSYLNGVLADGSDDIIDDFQLYCCVLRLSPWAERNPLARKAQWDEQCQAVLRDYQGPYPGAELRVAQGLRIILTAYTAARLGDMALTMAKALQEGSDMK